MYVCYYLCMHEAKSSPIDIMVIVIIMDSAYLRLHHYISLNRFWYGIGEFVGRHGRGWNYFIYVHYQILVGCSISKIIIPIFDSGPRDISLLETARALFIVLTSHSTPGNGWRRGRFLTDLITLYTFEKQTQLFILVFLGDVWDAFVCLFVCVYDSWWCFPL